MSESVWLQVKSSLASRVAMYFLGVLIVLSGFIVTFQFVDPAPPSVLTIAAGDKNGAYYRYAQSFKKILARDGVEVIVKETKGSVENLRLLTDSEQPVDLAFVQGGINVDTNGLATLGSLYFEPLWVFYRKNLAIKSIPNLKNIKLAIGSKGSGTHSLALAVLQKNGISIDSDTLVELDSSKALPLFLSGKIGALFLVASPNAPIVKQLLTEPNVSILNFRRAPAYAKIFSYLSVVDLPEGALNLANNLPSVNVSLLATSANLVGSKKLHPAIVNLVLQAAQEIHGKHGLFEKTGQFPTRKFISFPLHKEANRFYKFGPTLLQRYLPFWVANWIDRLKILLLPFLVLLIPLVKILPPFYRWLIRKRIYKWYAALRTADPEMQSFDKSQLSVCLARLDKIEDELKDVSIPLSYTDEFYNLRFHIEMVREKLQSYSLKD